MPAGIFVCSGLSFSAVPRPPDPEFSLHTCAHSRSTLIPTERLLESRSSSRPGSNGPLPASCAGPFPLSAFGRLGVICRPPGPEQPLLQAAPPLPPLAPPTSAVKGSGRRILWEECRSAHCLELLEEMSPVLKVILVLSSHPSTITRARNGMDA